MKRENVDTMLAKGMNFIKFHGQENGFLYFLYLFFFFDVFAGSSFFAYLNCMKNTLIINFLEILRYIEYKDRKK